MAGYTVKQIADMLNTNQETVRRWIREDKLHAVQTSRKDGNVVAEEEFQRFLKETPKYATRLASTLIPFSPGAGLLALLGTLAGGAALDYIVRKKTLVTSVLPEDAKEFIKKSIADLEGQINQKSQAIQQIESEIQELRTRVTAYRYLLEQGAIDGIDSIKLEEPETQTNGGLKNEK